MPSGIVEYIYILCLYIRVRLCSEYLLTYVLSYTQYTTYTPAHACIAYSSPLSLISKLFCVLTCMLACYGLPRPPLFLIWVSKVSLVENNAPFASSREALTAKHEHSQLASHSLLRQPTDLAFKSPLMIILCSNSSSSSRSKKYPRCVYVSRRRYVDRYIKWPESQLASALMCTRIRS